MTSLKARAVRRHLRSDDTGNAPLRRSLSGSLGDLLNGAIASANKRIRGQEPAANPTILGSVGRSEPPRELPSSTHMLRALVAGGRVREYGRLLAETDNLRFTVMKNITDLSDDHPPVLPTGRAFQSPSPRLLNQELADKLNRHMLDCAVKCSEELIMAQIEELEKLMVSVNNMTVNNDYSEQELAAAEELRRF
ncbi:hypothetical protein OUZ56_009529 [Daphnia magna]|uniref:Uncharacterized protein n=1 Tax=Daphnia magna TaxID=35525 RepID=A0ABR0AGA0_9CRUS|nr:hypothetical protein OUZ56_009529 [Daphnia magna]